MDQRSSLMWLRRLYRVARRAVTFVRVRVFNARQREWANRSLENARSYWDNRDDPRTDFLASIIDGFQPTSCLEVGSNVGNRLYRMAVRHPHRSYEGVDINRAAIDFGNQQYAAAGIENVRLFHARAQDLIGLGHDRYDVVFSWATLIYVPPHDIADVVRAMLELSTRACVLVEMNGVRGRDFRSSAGRLHPPGNWMRDYVDLVGQIDPTRAVEVISVPEEIWKPGGGGASAIVIRPGGIG